MREMEIQFPSFEDFKKNTSKFLGSDEDIFAEVDAASRLDGFRRRMNKVIYEIEGYRSHSLEKIYGIIRDYGIPFNKLDYKPELIPIGGGKCDVLVKFLSKDDRVKRADW